MPDIRLVQSPEAFPKYSIPIDWLLLDDGTLDDTQALATAVIVALGTDRLASPDDVLPIRTRTDRAGWWGDLDAEELFGRLADRHQAVAAASAPRSSARKTRRARPSRASSSTSARRSSRSSISRIASRFDVEAWRVGTERIDALVMIYRGPTRPVDLRFQVLWDEIERA